MDTLGVTLDVHYAAIDGHFAMKEGLFAVKEGAITAKDVSIVRMVGHFAVKCRDCERARVYFAVMKGGSRDDERTQYREETVFCGDNSTLRGDRCIQHRDIGLYHREVRVHCRDMTRRSLITPALYNERRRFRCPRKIL